MYLDRFAVHVDEAALPTDTCAKLQSFVTTELEWSASGSMVCAVFEEKTALPDPAARPMPALLSDTCRLAEKVARLPDGTVNSVTVAIHRSAERQMIPTTNEYRLARNKPTIIIRLGATRDMVIASSADAIDERVFLHHHAGHVVTIWGDSWMGGLLPADGTHVTLTFRCVAPAIAVLVVGVPGVGKTTLVRNVMRMTGGVQESRRVCPHVQLHEQRRGGLVVLGTYNVPASVVCQGTDLMSMSFRKPFVAWLRDNPSPPRRILAEGDRVSNDKVIADLEDLGYRVNIVFVDPPLEVQQKRHGERPHSQTVAFVESQRTKIRNFVFSQGHLVYRLEDVPISFGTTTLLNLLDLPHPVFLPNTKS